MRHILKSKWPLVGICVISLCTGAVLTYNLATELLTGHNSLFGTHNDFLAFYTAAHLVLHGQATALYNSAIFQPTQYAIFPHHVGAAGYMPFLNPPFAAALLSPLALISEPTARFIWFLINAVVAISLCWYFSGVLRIKHRWLALLLLLGTFPVYENLVEGQLSLLMLAGCCAALALAQKHRLFASGVFLSVLWLKPQLALVSIVILLVFRGWQVVGGMFSALLLLVMLTAPLTGLAPYLNYVYYLGSVLVDHLDGAGAVTSAVWQGSLHLTAGINGFFTGIFGQRAAAAVDAFTLTFDAILVACYAYAIYRIPRRSYGKMKPVILALSVSLVLLTDPHLYQQDVVLAYILLPILASQLTRPLIALAAVALTNLLILDYTLPLHPFTVLMFSGTIWACASVITKRDSATTRTAAPLPDPA